ISDFGLSKIAEELGGKGGENEGEPPLEQIPLRWMAPECLKRPQLWSLKSDVWSFGVLLYEIFNEGQKPWPDDPPKKIATLIRKGKMLEFPPKTPAQIKEMVAKIWSLTPDQRPTMNEIATSITALRKEIKLTNPSKAVIKQVISVSRSKSETNADDDDESLRSKTSRSTEK
ncbi:Protein kinase domain-containing protein, partial [Trichostrongylus colubriformis]